MNPCTNQLDAPNCQPDTPWVFVPHDATISLEDILNVPGTIVWYAGEPPTFIGGGPRDRCVELP
jgi:hypothetical protein